MSPNPRSPSSSGPSFFILVLGGVFFLINVWSFRQAYLLKQRGTSVEGVVSRLFILRRKGSLSYNVEYGFEAGGRHFAAAADLSRDSYLALRPGGSIRIRYAP